MLTKERADSFSTALSDLCKEHGVTLRAEGHDILIIEETQEQTLYIPYNEGERDCYLEAVGEGEIPKTDEEER